MQKYKILGQEVIRFPIEIEIEAIDSNEAYKIANEKGIEVDVIEKLPLKQFHERIQENDV